MEKELAASQSELQSKDKENANLRQQLEKQNKLKFRPTLLKYRNLKSNWQASQRELQSIKNQLQQERDTHQTIQADLTARTAERDYARTERDQRAEITPQELVNLQGERNRLNKELRDIQDKLTKAGKTGKHWKSKYDKSHTRCQQLAEEKENLITINDNLTNDLEDKIIDEELYQRDNETKNKSLTAEIRSLKGKLTRLNKKLTQQLEKEKYWSQELQAKKQKLTKAYRNGQTFYDNWQQEANISNNVGQQLVQAQNIILQAQIHLGVADLNNLPNMDGKTLLELIDYAKVDCHLPHHTDYDIIKQERDDYKLQLEQYVCSCPEICCVKGDSAS